MVTAPVTARGRIVFGVGCGVMTGVIRAWGGYPEGVCYSILFMNMFVPFIDRYTQSRWMGA
jgi:electron transport complex protein RnfD